MRISSNFYGFSTSLGGNATRTLGGHVNFFFSHDTKIKISLVVTFTYIRFSRFAAWFSASCTLLALRYRLHIALNTLKLISFQFKTRLGSFIAVHLIEKKYCLHDQTITTVREQVNSPSDFKAKGESNYWEIYVKIQFSGESVIDNRWRGNDTVKFISEYHFNLFKDTRLIFYRFFGVLF